MEEYLKTLTNELQTESDSLSRLLEPGYKQIAVQTFDCMSACFKRTGTADQCGDCADRCNKKLESFQVEMDERMRSIQLGFQNCAQSCAVMKEDPNVMKQCIGECSSETKALISRTKSQVDDIVSKFLV
jgi:hypothetical protein